MSDLNTLISEHLDDSRDDAEVAAAVAAEFTTLKEYREATFRILVDEVRRHRRLDTRDLETAAHIASNPGIEVEVREGEECDPVTQRNRFLASRVFIPGKGYIPWGEATVADHQARIDYLAKLAAGLRDTIAKHEDAIRAIQAAGVSCLAEVKDVGEAA